MVGAGFKPRPYAGEGKIPCPIAHWTLTKGLKSGILPALRPRECGHDRQNFVRSFTLANTAQAKKRARQAEKHRELNSSQRSTLRTAIKKAVNAIKGGNKTEAAAAYQAAVPVIDAMARKGLIHMNKAARHKSRLNSHIKALA